MHGPCKHTMRLALAWPLSTVPKKNAMMICGQRRQRRVQRGAAQVPPACRVEALSCSLKALTVMSMRAPV